MGAPLTVFGASLDEQGAVRLRRGATERRLDARWLRDHCACARCEHPVTRQRLAPVPRGEALRVTAVETRGARLEVRFADGHLVTVPATRLEPEAHATEDPTPWVAADVVEPRVPYGEVVAGDEGLRAWLDAVARVGFAFVDEVPATPEATRALAERIGYLRQSPFGAFWDFTADLAHADTAYTTLAIGPHTDGTYHREPPGLQLFHCLSFEGEGGESLLVDGLTLDRRLRDVAPEARALLARVPVPWRYLEAGVHLRAVAPVLSLTDAGRLRTLRFNPADRAPFHPPPGWYDAWDRLVALAGEDAATLRFRLRPGLVLLFDNQRLLHGRTAFEGVRRLCGAYLDRDVFESRRRVLGGGGAAPPDLNPRGGA